MRRVVITGLGVVSPVGIGKEVFWENLLQGHSGAINISDVNCCSLFGHHEFGAQVVCEASDFDPNTHHVPQAYHTADRFIQFAFAATHQAFHDSKLDQHSWDASRAGITLATAICGTQTLDLEFTKATNYGQEGFHAEGVSPFLYFGAMGNSASLAVGAHYGLQGECSTLSTGCIGGLDAISYAYESIAYGDHDIMLAGPVRHPLPLLPSPPLISSIVSRTTLIRPAHHAHSIRTAMALCYRKDVASWC
ncbi:hypothetical protein KDK_50590 [Dictyobacter kobayashii]|uniref:Nodulation protein E n=1 Tax=Dictyobacter kobayashii TaxID=2014872 RepID=A0A402AQF0_9CHLR|nr:beta-ketoacyl synthase N-terminal-like domain-containing protein [Dictyobacter kobayashii]GCE21259.1 hypothetical protein KDK_50590 [Dictyobacter kobayashii]